MKRDFSAVPRASLAILLACASCHLINDTMQSLLTSIYPLLKAEYGLTFIQIGLLTFAFQITASLLQPLIGAFTDRHPLPFAAPIAMLLTAAGLILLARATNFPHLLGGATLIGLGSSLFHPETSRISRMAAGEKIGLGQSLFQVGGNAGAALGPLAAAFIILPYGQKTLAWLSLIAGLGFVILWRLGRWAAAERKAQQGRINAPTPPLFSRKKTWAYLVILVALTAGKQGYLASLSSYLTFYTIEKFDLTLREANYLLFFFLASSACGVLLGGSIGDRFGRRFVIWLSVLGVIPFALLLPFASLFGTIVLVALIGFMFSSAFPAIVVFAQELLPGRVGLVSGLFFGFSFGFGALGASLLGWLADQSGITTVYSLSSLIPLTGLVALGLPKLTRK